MAMHVVIKIGGAAITDKNRLEELNAQALRVIALHVAELVHRGLQIILVHGAGGFGHHQARSGGLAAGGTGDREAVLRSVACTHASVRRLNGLVVDALVQAGVPAAGVSPLGCWTTNQRELVAEDDNCAAVRAMLEGGLVPVLHGDVVRDAHQAWAILSGDTILARLCKVFQPQLAVFMTNVAGLYDRPPELPVAQLIRSVAVQAGGSCAFAGSGGQELGLLTNVAGCDVTGGMHAKLAEAAAAVPHVRHAVRIVQAATPHALAACEVELAPEWAGTELRQVQGGKERSAAAG